MEMIERTAEQQRRIDLLDLKDSRRTAADLADRIGDLAGAADRAATALMIAVAEAERLRGLLLETAEAPADRHGDRGNPRSDGGCPIMTPTAYTFEPRDVLQVDDPKYGWLTWYILLGEHDGRTAEQRVRNGGGRYRIVRNGKGVVFGFEDVCPFAK